MFLIVYQAGRLGWGLGGPREACSRELGGAGTGKAAHRARELTDHGRIVQTMSLQAEQPEEVRPGSESEGPVSL